MRAPLTNAAVQPSALGPQKITGPENLLADPIVTAIQQTANRFLNHTPHSDETITEISVCGGDSVLSHKQGNPWPLRPCSSENQMEITSLQAL